MSWIRPCPPPPSDNLNPLGSSTFVESGSISDEYEFKDMLYSTVLHLIPVVCYTSQPEKTSESWQYSALAEISADRTGRDGTGRGAVFSRLKAAAVRVEPHLSRETICCCVATRKVPPENLRKEL